MSFLVVLDERIEHLQASLPRTEAQLESTVHLGLSCLHPFKGYSVLHLGSLHTWVLVCVPGLRLCLSHPCCWQASRTSQSVGLSHISMPACFSFYLRQCSASSLICLNDLSNYPQTLHHLFGETFFKAQLGQNKQFPHFVFSLNSLQTPIMKLFTLRLTDHLYLSHVPDCESVRGRTWHL